ncbi:MAG TPA: hypothetical protein VIW93_15500 [Candidatus Acidoferrum sp.]
MATIPLPFKGVRPRDKVDAKRVVELRARGLSWLAIGRKLRVGTGTAFTAAQGRSKIVSKSTQDENENPQMI